MILPIKKKWFDMILSGKKKEEYREINGYYEIRFMNLFGAIIIEPTSISESGEYEVLQGNDVPEEIRKKPIQEIMFRNGYGKNAPSLIAKCTLSVGTGRKEWGAEKDRQYFILTIWEILPGTIKQEA